MKPWSGAPIALTLLMGMALAGKILPGAGSIPASAQEPAAGAPIPARSPLFEALERRATDDAARRRAGARSVEAAGSVEPWDRKRAFAEMERLRAEIVMLGGLRGAQQELLLWNRERIKSGAAPAVLPARLCRAAALGAWCAVLPATFGAAVRRPGESAARSTGKFTPNAAPNAAPNSGGPADEPTPPNQPGNKPTEDELP